MEQEQAYLVCAKRLYPAAALYLGSLSEARAALTEAIAAACRKEPAAWEHEVLAQLLRICGPRAPERVTVHDFPPDAALAPLMPALKLPVSSRRNLGLSLCVTTVDAAAARGVTIEEMEHKIEKAFRQLTFMQSGEPPEPEKLAEASAHLPWTEADSAALLRGLEEARQNAEIAAPTVRNITQNTASSSKSSAKQVTVPLWGIVAAGAVMLGLLTVMLVQMLYKPALPQPELPAEINAEKLDSLMAEDYLRIGAAQSLAAKDAGIAETAAVWVSSKLKTDEDPVIYEIVFRCGERQYTYTLDAKTGEILSKDTADDIAPWATEKWLPAEQLRGIALARAGLQDALILREKFSSDGENGSCKYELLDGSGKEYSLLLDTGTGRLLKYEAEMLRAEEPENIISTEEAVKLALARVSIGDPSQVIFTKIKLEGDVYLIAFSLNDGTQYVLELNAETGGINATDVHPVSADASQTIGLLKAREYALHMAELEKAPDVEFTKAKIERSAGSYVYELEFEAQQWEYEVTMNAQTGEILKYRAWDQ